MSKVKVIVVWHVTDMTTAVIQHKYITTI